MKNTNSIMLSVFVALIPALFVKIYFWGWNTLLLLIISIATAACIEILVAKMRQKEAGAEFKNNSALVTCMLITLSLPPNIPFYVILIVTLFAILIAKQVYGGMGQNIFNPAMIGVALFIVTYPQFITYWSIPQNSNLVQTWSSFLGKEHIDAFTQATPLTEVKTILQVGGNSQTLLETISKLTTENYFPWLVYNLAFVLGGVYLLLRKTITLLLPVCTLIGFLGVASIHYLSTGYAHASPAYALIYGSAIFGAFFIVTDPVTTPQYRTARIIYGLLVGALMYIIRAFTNYNDGVAFAVILCNILVPMFDRVFTPKEFGK
ncbi:RnfABCDGE type electron transport complex subunit D [Psittacicella gerlachiana]|uniref:Ion-translocating oxidoreductase complex subunit D n=1 Tax=Psittacicella gerlachiana TaxID=2028574 RepID=A0A3A1YIX8_9GAMM|nr:RnfABCDGE type electron transport complex subunit D [Psittacicella gerlachiana]RIY37158.1 hypothetical protein CKF59_01925 [Psittacicella gerlachiana]